MNRKRLGLSLLGAGLLAALALPVLAQDATPEATPEAPAATMAMPANAVAGGH